MCYVLLYSFRLDMNIYGQSKHGAKQKWDEGGDNTLVHYNSKSIVLNLNLNKDKRQNILQFQIFFMKKAGSIKPKDNQKLIWDTFENEHTVCTMW